ncbi:sensor histidine kinase [Paenibacillus agricola]|uniref:Sensor histidine kinase n=1 Tax=Paenibacillus agricola TaxID=2716264 RepID=A0ABX0JEE9_9BACL|nr:histidine kinase [Paenibacillus agricola]NHN34912.1 sensor histidine kinase [Paenibacillus agricola]
MKIANRIALFRSSISFKRKMIFLMMFTLVGVVILIEVVIYNVSIPLQMKSAMNENTQDVKYISDRLDMAISNTDWFMNSLTMDAEVQQILKNPYTSSLEENLLNFDLEQVLNSKSILATDKIENIFIYDTQKYRSSILNSHDFDIGYLHLNKNSYNSEGNIDWKVEAGKVYINRAIRDRKSLKLIGYMTVSLNLGYFQEMINTATKRYTYIVNENGQLMIGNGDASVVDFSQVMEKAKGLTPNMSEIITIAPLEEAIIVMNTSHLTLWSTISIVPLSQVASETRLISKWIIGIGIVGVFIGTLITWISFQHLMRPLEELIRVMKQVDQDNFDLQVNISQNDEFGRLGKSFNRMMNRINYLVSEVYIKELSWKEAEYKALKAQINPHFLYNTLETIRYLAEFDEQEKIMTITIALGRLFKASIDNKNDYSSVRDELVYIDAYLKIQNTRFQDKVDVYINVDDVIMESMIPRFILQPLVENAFVHGLENKIGKGSLMIKGWAAQETIHFQIEDDGIGMTLVTLDELFRMDRSAQEEKKGTGTGFLNVHNRIKMLYGDGYGLTIQSSPNVGTIVEAQMPMIHSEKGGSSHAQGSNN